ncbi:monothiol glutaredoxin-S11 [Dendrobium catenatum]|uniref:Monothiol glutaredoxin-S11 n=1 Tax=Dendrobium catenatum TaxID=906689 RepID=A0A2I0VTV1_9ASPA|nr:monothiol glutaredoxin-S11 [Dendrobium catenatum]PKU66842.1 Monothiol glutaredoxin-S11 [Dendrobium catenatum]
MGVVKDVQSKAELSEALAGGAPAAIHFWASWCEASKQMDQVFSHLCTDFPHVLFLRVEAEEQPEISDAYAVSAVPYFVFCKDGKASDTLEGANPAVLANKVAKIAGTIDNVESAAPASLGMAAGPTVLETVKDLARQNGSSKTETKISVPTENLTKRLQQLVNSHHVFLFMKGNPEQPKCKFSRRVVEILKNEGVEFGSFDILLDDDVREGMKKFSNWPTFPQLYCKGELLGGCDIVVAMHESGELKDVFRDQGILFISKENIPSSAAQGSGKGGTAGSTTLSTALASRLGTLINSSPVVLFMKGKPDEPKCGFSSKVVDLLKQEKIEFQSFDVLSDDEIRQGLKTFSNWSSFPQLYIKGELIGGSDVVLEMHKSGGLKKILAEKGIIQEEKLEDRLKNLISSSPVMLFMKGKPDAPCCGFSSKVVNALREEGISFGSFDILSDEEVRQGLKTYSNWPTFPQLYYQGDLIGGCDIVLELSKTGELKATLSE